MKSTTELMQHEVCINDEVLVETSKNMSWPSSQSFSAQVKPSSADRFFLFVCSAAQPRKEYTLESIYIQQEDAPSAFARLIKGNVWPDLVLFTDTDEADIPFIDFLKSKDTPAVLYTPKFDLSARAAALRLGLDDYLSGAINDEFIIHSDFLKKFKPYKLNFAASMEKENSAQGKKKMANMNGLKRFSDIMISFFLLLLISPLLIVIALLIKLESRGPVFYTSKRSGTGYKVFSFYKFRTMRQGADSELSKLAMVNQYGAGGENPVFFKIKNDPRVTRLGRVLRKLSLDELPQLFNVLKGDMSFVGNRPLPLYEAEKLTCDQTSRRFLAPAGITGLWQVTKRAKENMSPQERIQLDIDYAKHCSFLFDMGIILKTIPALLQQEQV